MTRFLLALLAMLTGIAVTGQPVSARICSDEASEVRSVDCAVVAEATGERAMPGDSTGSAPNRRAARSAPPEGAPAVPTRTVRIRCDRALE